MKGAVVIVGVVLIVLGLVIAVFANSAQDPIRAAMATDCYGSSPNPFVCLQDMSALGNWIMIFWGGAALVLVGVVVAIIGAVLAAAVGETPAPAAAAPPVAVQTAQSANCPRCGKPLAFVPQYGRWWCAAENTYI